MQFLRQFPKARVDLIPYMSALKLNLCFSHTKHIDKKSILSFSKSFSTTARKLKNVDELNGVKLGFETSPYSIWSDESILIEKSLRNGCRVLVTQSSPVSLDLEQITSLTSIYELIQDLHLIQEVDLSSLNIVHRLRSKSISIPHLNTSISSICLTPTEFLDILSSWRKEIETIHAYLDPHSISLVTLPACLIYTTISSLSSSSSTPIESSLQTIQKCIDDLVPFLLSKSNDITLGLDFNTELLSHLSDDEFHQCLEVIQEVKRLSTTRKLISTITVACNAWTYDRASKLMHLGKALGIQVIATEVLRVHYKRPGYSTTVLTPASALTETIHHKLLNIANNQDNVLSTAIEKNSIPSNSSNTSNLELLQKSMDTCMKLEKQFLNKFILPLKEKDGANNNLADMIANGSIPNPAYICWAHNLVQTFSDKKNNNNNNNNTQTIKGNDNNDKSSPNSILFLEEWNFLLHSKINRLLKETSKSIKSLGEAEENWVTIYKPLAIVMFRCYTSILQERKVLLVEELYQLLKEKELLDEKIKLEDVGVGITKLEDVPLGVGIIASSLSTDVVCLTDTQITSDMQRSFLSASSASNYSESSTSNDIVQKNKLSYLQTMQLWKNISDIVKSYDI